VWAAGSAGRARPSFHNNGDGTFMDVSVKAGVSDPAATTGLADCFLWMWLMTDGWTWQWPMVVTTIFTCNGANGVWI